ncbi:MAG: LLM class F420-dependent oxidoreductase [Gammaproteobacteria bacterium]|jgi:probable F420-dependent oxidoreductase|nr:LLM class F420-dependent oxidoreductase [Gammaproteobacteria bacterium]MBT4493806.1 LLM class F420-dependent oxidoreductase [Gammaproteobacteria bacterium]
MSEFGIVIFPTAYSMQPVELAKAVESRGLDSIFVPEHTHIPASRRTPYPAGGDLPKEYSNTYDPFVFLTACAAVTEHIKLGTGICLVVERDVLTLAKEIASLDRISDGRFILGIGAGWNAEEMENHGIDYSKRWKVVREKILAMRELWTKDEAEFHGEFVDFDPVWSNPKPVQPGGPPVWMGATSKWSYDRIAEYCDGWLPIAGLDDGHLPKIEEALVNRGRKLSDITLAMFGLPPDEDFINSKIEEGYTHFCFGVPPESADTVLPMLDQYAAIAEKIRG